MNEKDKVEMAVTIIVSIVGNKVYALTSNAVTKETTIGTRTDLKRKEKNWFNRESRNGQQWPSCKG